MRECILITGATGQVGTNLTYQLIERYGISNVVASDIKQDVNFKGQFVMLDILNPQRLKEIIKDFGVTQIYHLAAILSADGEWNPLKTWNVNFNGLITILEAAVKYNVRKVFFPSTIAVFGNNTPLKDTPQHTNLEPETVYGISKASGEMWCYYYSKRYGLDVRSLRYPGIIGHDSIPGGGTTDYAVEIFLEALDKGTYTCFLKPDVKLPMIYMPDAIRGTLELMEAKSKNLSVRHSYNLASMSFSPAELAAEISKHLPEFSIEYEPDFRQKIAESWTESIDDSQARKDWGWRDQYNIESLTSDMLYHLKKE